MEKAAHIKNPLTVISIFAGVAEISGAAVLPFVASDNQNLYIWFLMLFPFGLVAFFFATLNWNYRVLYAPSDFRDEDNFVSILQKSTVAERFDKLSEETEVVVGLPSTMPDLKTPEATPKEEEPESSAAIQSSTQSMDYLLQETAVSTKERRKQLAELTKKLFGLTRRESSIAERLALEKLSKDLGVDIEVDKKIATNRARYVLDGVINKDGKITAVEVRYARTLRNLGKAFLMGLDSLLPVYESFSQEQRRSFSLIFVLVTDEDDQSQREAIRRQLDRLPFQTAIMVYDYDSLINELLPKEQSE